MGRAFTTALCGTLVTWSLVACGGLVEAEQSDPSRAAGADAGDSGPRATGEETTSEHRDASDADLPPCVVFGPYGYAVAAGNCTPPPEAPPDDTVSLTPNPLSVPAGGGGLAQVVASGPWVAGSDAALSFSYQSGTIQTAVAPYLVTQDGGTYLVISLPIDAKVGSNGSMSFDVTNGYFSRTVRLEVIVTPCVPYDALETCMGATCGTMADGCGGSLSCGSCGESAPYCWHGVPPFGAACIPCKPIHCGLGSGFDGASCTCESCGGCSSIDDVCVCASSSGTLPPGFP